RTERRVIMAATRSSEECSASERTPRLPVLTTRNVLRETNTTAEPTLKSAALLFSRLSSTWGVVITVRLDYLNFTQFPECNAILQKCPRDDIRTACRFTF